MRRALVVIGLSLGGLLLAIGVALGALRLADTGVDDSPAALKLSAGLSGDPVGREAGEPRFPARRRGSRSAPPPRAARPAADDDHRGRTRSRKGGTETKRSGDEREDDPQTRDRDDPDDD